MCSTTAVDNQPRELMARAVIVTFLAASPKSIMTATVGATKPTVKQEPAAVFNAFASSLIFSSRALDNGR